MNWRRIRQTAICLAALTVAVLPNGVTAQAATKTSTDSQYEPQAIRILQEMALAYSRLSSLRQETEFTSILISGAPLPAGAPTTPESDAETGRPPTANALGGRANSERRLDRKLRLSFAARNRMRLEVEDTDDAGKVQLSTWVSDGKTFWTFNQEKNLFTREKAPASIRDFARLAHMTSGSLEILMLMGVNPFDRIEQQTEGVRCAGRETIRGVETDVVSMMADLGPQTTETRLYVGAENHLLYRIVSETEQKPRPPVRTGVGSPLDELATGNAATDPAPNPDGPSALPMVPRRSRVVCDNKIETDPTFGYGAFSFSPPEGANYLTNPVQDQKPLTMKQRIAELNRAARRQKKPAPKIYRY